MGRRAARQLHRRLDDELVVRPADGHRGLCHPPVQPREPVAARGDGGEWRGDAGYWRGAEGGRVRGERFGGRAGGGKGVGHGGHVFLHGVFCGVVGAPGEEG